MPLPEELRQEYLQALGIASYFPRMQLPGAPASVIVNLPVVEPEQTSAEVPEFESNPPVEIVEPAEPVRERVITKPAPAPSTTHAPKQTAVEATDDEVVPARSRPATEEVRLLLLCIRASDDLAVINALPHIGPGHLSPRHSALLTNLLSACGIPADNMLVEDKPFRWPMVTGLHVDNSKRAAAAALSAYLHQKLTDWKFNKLLVMGEEVVTRIFTSDEQDDGESHKRHSLDKDEWQIIYTRSLDELLHRPALKKETWVRIRKLRA